nr:MAG TPA: hypothetical protein [Caudoviricetes sp.]
MNNGKQKDSESVFFRNKIKVNGCGLLGYISVMSQQHIGQIQIMDCLELDI